MEAKIGACIRTFGQLHVGSVFHWIPRGESVSPGCGRFVKRAEDRALETNSGESHGFGPDELVLVRADEEDEQPTPLPRKAFSLNEFGSGPIHLEELARRLLDREGHRPSRFPPAP